MPIVFALNWPKRALTQVLVLQRVEIPESQAIVLITRRMPDFVKWVTENGSGSHARNHKVRMLSSFGTCEE
jgi:hypothetical protein